MKYQENSNAEKKIYSIFNKGSYVFKVRRILKNNQNKIILCKVLHARDFCEHLIYIFGYRCSIYIVYTHTYILYIKI